MIKKLLAFTAIFIFCLSFAQYAPKDSIRPKCNGILKDPALSYIVYAFATRINRPPGPGYNFGCGTAAMEYAEERSCENAISILKKYPFIIREIKSSEEKTFKLSDLNILWVQNELQGPSNDPVEKKKNELQYKRWETKKQNSPLSVSITVNVKELEKEDIIIQFLYADQKKDIIKKYKVYKNPDWNFTKL